MNWQCLERREEGIMGKIWGGLLRNMYKGHMNKPKGDMRAIWL